MENQNLPDTNRFIVTTCEDILKWVHSYVWTGEYDADDIVILIEESLIVDEEVDEVWLNCIIQSELAIKQEAEKTWPEVTDCDRLYRVFRALEEEGFIALHMAGFTKSDGLEEVEDDYDWLGDEKSNYAGHCYYTTQDQQGALNGSGMCISFGHLFGDEAKDIEVGKKVRAALEREGFLVEWDESAHIRLLITDFRWQRRLAP